MTGIKRVAVYRARKDEPCVHSAGATAKKQAAERNRSFRRQKRKNPGRKTSGRRSNGQKRRDLNEIVSSTSDGNRVEVEYTRRAEDLGRRREHIKRTKSR